MAFLLKLTLCAFDITYLARKSQDKIDAKLTLLDNSQAYLVVLNCVPDALVMGQPSIQCSWEVPVICQAIKWSSAQLCSYLSSEAVQILTRCNVRQLPVAFALLHCSEAALWWWSGRISKQRLLMSHSFRSLILDSRTILKIQVSMKCRSKPIYFCNLIWHISKLNGILNEKNLGKELIRILPSNLGYISQKHCQLSWSQRVAVVLPLLRLPILLGNTGLVSFVRVCLHPHLWRQKQLKTCCKAMFDQARSVTVQFLNASFDNCQKRSNRICPWPWKQCSLIPWCLCVSEMSY